MSGTGGKRGVGLGPERLRIWLAGLRLGAAVLSSSPMLALKRFALPVSYWRCAEFAYASRALPCGDAYLLDVGSPKELAAILARWCESLRLTATDILPAAVAAAAPYARALRRDQDHTARMLCEVQDGRELAYEDDSFDAAYCISVLEHIPGEGDSAAVRELVRVVRPGGRVVITVPYDGAGYRETWVADDVYERRREADEQVFYQRHYDETTLRERLIRPSAAELVDLELWGEPRLPVERLLGSFPRLSLLTSPLEPLLSLLFLRRLEAGGGARAMAAFLTLRTPAS